MKLSLISLTPAVALLFADCTNGFYPTAMDQTKHFPAQPMDAYYAQQSLDLVNNEQGKECSRVGSGDTFTESFEHWKRRGTGMHYFGHGYKAGDHAVEYACYMDHGHIMYCGVGPITSSFWKNGGERNSVGYW